MPQSAILSAVAVNPSGVAKPLKVDAAGALILSPGTSASTLNITAATVVKATPGTVLGVTVVVAGSAAGAIHDCATTGAAAAANVIWVTPATVGSVAMDWPCEVGIVVSPGTGQTIAVSWN